MENHADVGRELVDSGVDGEHFKPYTPAEARIPEFTVKATIVGLLIGVVFGIANAYLALRVGMTVTASIPAAVIGIAIFRLIGKGTILESNMVQTMGSAGEAVAGLVFIIPVFFLWGMDPGQLKIFLLTVFGGVLGVLFMIPLRQHLIVKEHGKLPFPEGVACAEVLISHQEGGSKAATLFWGIGLGGLYQFLSSPNFLGFWQEGVGWLIPGYRKAHFGIALAPEILGIGFIIGPKIASMAFSGAVLSSLVIVPLIAIFGQNDPQIAAMSAAAIRSEYARMIGAGAVGVAGIITILRTAPIIWQSIIKSLKGLRSGGAGTSRIVKDIDLRIVVIASVVMIIAMVLLPERFIPVGILGAICITVFGFLFVAVASRVAGLIGCACSPVSGMMIATLLMTAGLFLAFGLTGDITWAKVSILSIGTITALAMCTSGDIAQDLKTGFLVGGTPYKQQIGQIISVIVSALALSYTIYLFKGDIIAGRLQAPQANLMAIVIDGVVTQQLPWDMIIIGGVVAIVMELMGLPSLAIALGIYLPLPLLTPTFIGGLLRWIVQKAGRKDKEVLATREEHGILYASGLVAGAALVGVIVSAIVGGVTVSGRVSAIMHHVAGITAIRPDWYTGTAEPFLNGLGTAGSLIVFCLLTLSMIYFSCRKR